MCFILIGLLAFVMWFLIFERMWFYYLTHKNYLGISVSEWETRQDKSSWNSKAIRDMLISENSIRIDQNLSLIKMCVGIAPLIRIVWNYNWNDRSLSLTRCNGWWEMLRQWLEVFLDQLSLLWQV